MAEKEDLSKKEIKEKAIKKEFNRLKRTLKKFDLDKNRLSTAEGLMHEIAFMRVTLQELKRDINENGTVEEMPQGDYSIMRESPSVKTYNTMIQRYTTANKELMNLLPKEKPKQDDDGFDAFVNRK